MVGETYEQESIKFLRLGIYLDKHLTFKQQLSMLIYIEMHFCN